MKRTKFQRLVTLMLCLAFVLSGFSVTAYATGNPVDDTEGQSSSIYDASKEYESLNTISYAQYLKDARANEATDSIVINAVHDLYWNGDKGTTVPVNENTIIKVDGKDALLTPSTGTAAWKVDVPEKALYTITLVYYSYVKTGEETKADSIERVLKINNEIPFSEARNITIKKNWLNDYPDAKYIGKENKAEVYAKGVEAGLYGQIKDGELTFAYPEYWTDAITDFCEEYGIRFMKRDIYNNEIRPAAFQSPVWSEYTVTDSMGFYTEAFTFVLEKGQNIIALEGKNADLAIGEIILSPSKKTITYNDYKEIYKGQPDGKGSIKIEAEYTANASDKTIYPVEDSANAMTSPHDPGKTVLNTMEIGRAHV